ncbi:hypothetical protein GCM10027612_40970 [Microbispora bryophytorum subsp. camponoti]
MRGVEDDFEELYEHAPCGYLSTLPDGTIVRVNRTLLELTGYAPGELTGGMRIQNLLAVGDRIFYETHFAPLLAMQSVVREIAVDVRRADGTRLPVLLNAVMRDDPGVIRFCVFAATDRREYERELLRARQHAERSEAEARELARTLQRSFIPRACRRFRGSRSPGHSGPPGAATRWAATSTTCTRPWTAGSSPSATCAARAWRPPSSPAWPATRCGPRRSGS